MPRGYHKAWHPMFAQDEKSGDRMNDVEQTYRYVNPMPVGTMPQSRGHRKGHELVATEQMARGGYTVQGGRSIADYWSVKGAPINGKGNKATKRSGKNAGSY